MLYRLFIFPAIMALFVSVGAQEAVKKEIDVRIGIGLYTHSFFNEAKFNGNSPFEFLPIFGKPGIQGTGARNASASIGLDNNLQAGLSFLHQRIYVNYSVYDIQYRLDHFALLPHLNYTYLKREKTSLYSGLATGPAILHRNILEQRHNEKNLLTRRPSLESEVEKSMHQSLNWVMGIRESLTGFFQRSFKP